MGQNITQGIGAGYPILQPPRIPDAAASAAPASTDSAALEQYIWRAVPSLQTRNYTLPYNGTPSAQHTPTLKKGRKNRILLYNGCFNPPHRGHLAHLQHAFRHCGADINVVGALVLVAANHFIQWKYGRNSNDIRLDVKQRVDLWREGLRAAAENKNDDENREGKGEGVNWCWVLPENDWPRVADVLERDFANDGFDVEFVGLVGGDKVSTRYVQHGSWGCRMTITTNISRPLDFYDNSGNTGGSTLKNLRNHTPWKLVSQPSEEEEQQIREKIQNDAFGEPAYGQILPRPVFMCKKLLSHNSNTEYTLRFVSAIPSERLDPNLSSTSLRAIITEARAQTRYNDVQAQITYLADRLRDVALCPDLLAEYIAEKWEKEENAKNNAQLSRGRRRRS
ncbi:hypothetical protein F4805DRAFT_309060 [Annulohypoxylon moriforme]|nr:hypothetical protein F4805DRAFT_309060 [Annulohypoxylon moriforme]